MKYIERKTSWFDEQNYFSGRNASSVAMFVTEVTGVKVDVQKTDSSLVMNYVGRDGTLQTVKIPCHVIYILNRNDLTPLVQYAMDSLVKIDER
jgi:hypothetical protein